VPENPHPVILFFHNTPSQLLTGIKSFIINGVNLGLIQMFQKEYVISQMSNWNLIFPLP
jgi:hypothetical protein